MSAPALTESQQLVYDALPRDGSLCNRDLAEKVQMSPGWTSEVLRALERKGLARGTVKQDRRDPHTRWKMWRRL